MAKPPVILAFDTSGHAFVAGLDDGKRLSQSRTGGLVYHSEKIFKTLDELVKGPGKFKRIDLVAVGLGPGSFTGIRVGVTVAKTLAYALKAKIAGISSLEIIAKNCESADKQVCVIQDARRNKVYTATYRRGKCVHKPQLMHFGEFLSLLSEDTLYVGDGVEKLAPTLRHKFGRNAYVRDKRKWYPHLRPLMALAHQRWDKRKFDHVVSLVPQYLYEDTCNVTKAKKSKV